MRILGISRQIVNLQAVSQVRRLAGRHPSQMAGDIRDATFNVIRGSEGGQFIEGTIDYSRNLARDLGFRSGSKKDKRKQTGDSVRVSKEFEQYQIGLFSRLDRIIDLLHNLGAPSLAIQAAMIQSPEESPKRKESDAIIPSIFALAIGGLGGGLRIASILGSGIFGAAIGRRVRSWLRNRRNVRARNNASRVANRATGMTNPRQGPISRAAGSVIRRLGGLGSLLRGLGRLASRIPLLAVLITPITEAIESNAQVRALNEQFENGEITEAEMRQRATESVVRAVIDTIGTLGGGILGGLLGGGVASLVTGAAGAAAGHWLAGWVGDRFAPQIAAAINSTNTDQIIRAISDTLTGQIPLRDILSPHLSEDVVDRIVAAYEGAQEVGANVQRSWNWVARSASDTWSNVTRMASGETIETIAAPSVTPTPEPIPATQQTQTISHPEINNSTTTILINRPTTNVVNQQTTVVRRSKGGMGSFNEAAAYG